MQMQGGGGRRGRGDRHQLAVKFVKDSYRLAEYLDHHRTVVGTKPLLGKARNHSTTALLAVQDRGLMNCTVWLTTKGAVPPLAVVAMKVACLVAIQALDSCKNLSANMV